MELFKASRQWSDRPCDERFWTVAEAMASCRQYADTAIVLNVPYSNVRVEAQGEELRLGAVNAVGVPDAKLSHYAFGQLCMRGNPSAPAGYLRKLPPTLAAQNLNYVLKGKCDDSVANLLIQPANGDKIMRASVSDIYSRLWNYEVFNKLQDFNGTGWKTPPARSRHGDPRARLATAEDVLLSSSIQIGEEIGPAGIYASDHDMFVFMVNDDKRIEEGLSRGFFIWNSEVGDKSFGVMLFWYNHVCGNHIVWDAKGVVKIKVRHVGDVRKRGFQNVVAEIQKYADSSISDEKAIVEHAKTVVLGKTKDDITETFLNMAKAKRVLGLTKGAVDTAYDIAETHIDRYGAPNTVWAMVNGVTQYSQSVPYADERTMLDRAAGKLLAA